jgi:hypothetical protein
MNNMSKPRSYYLRTGSVLLRPVRDGMWEWWVADMTGRASEPTWYRFQRIYVPACRRDKYRWQVPQTGQTFRTLELAVEATANAHRAAQGVCNMFAALREWAPHVRANVTITIYHDIGDESEEWVVGDDGGEFDDECFSGENAEGEARDDAAGRFLHYRELGHEVVQEQV